MARDWVRIVEQERCDECGLEAHRLDYDEVPDALRDEGDAWGSLLEELTGSPQLRARPQPGVWSALEYGAHVRDVLALMRRRIRQALEEDEPEFAWWDHEAAATDGGYNDQDPAEVARVLVENAERLADDLADVAPEDRSRAGTRRESERFTVAGLGRYALHESVHHRHDANASAGRDRPR